MITAVFNPGAHIDQLIDSLLAQSLPRDEWEVVFVDDDSTDGSRQRLQAFAAGRPNVTVLHNTPNSGWPGRPRNLGVDVARGTYVFFADHDDWLPADALERLVDFADEHGSDVVVPKETGHGHSWGWEAFASTKPRAEIGTDPLWVPPTPHKLFRRSFLVEHGIRFPEGKVRLEDHLVITKAYFAADVVSTYSDHVCYHWVHRDDNNASLQQVDPRSYFRDLDGVLDVVAANTEPGELRDRLYRQWYVVNMLRRVGSATFVDSSAEHQQRLFDEVRRITLARFAPSMDDALASRDRARAHLVRVGRLDLLRLLAQHDVATTASVATTDLHWSGDVLMLTASAVLVDRSGSPVPLRRDRGRVLRAVPGPVADELPPDTLDITDAVDHAKINIVLRDRTTRDVADVASQGQVTVVDHEDGLRLAATVRAAIDPRTAFLGNALPRISDVWLRLGVAGWESERRLPFGGAAGPLHRFVDGADVSAYATQDTDNLSVRRTVRPPAARPSTGGLAQKVVRAGLGRIRRLGS